MVVRSSGDLKVQLETRWVLEILCDEKENEQGDIFIDFLFMYYRIMGSARSVQILIVG